MPFDNSKTPTFDNITEMTYGERVQVITPGAADQTDTSGRYYKYIVPAETGDVTILGYRNADTDTPVTLTAQGGVPIPGRVRRVTASTVELHGWSD